MQLIGTDKGPRIEELRGLLPEWSWCAMRRGFGWDYMGVNGSRTVVIGPVAMLCGPAEDDYRGSWMADDGETKLLWWLWVNRQLDGIGG